jgi:hypothetical protein
MKAQCPITSRRRGATTTEYIAILALIVLPIGLMLPLFLNMVRVYGARVISLVGLPFP